jgi:ABC-2 type transport system permease protein
MLAILKRELRSYFVTSSAYVYLASMLFFMGLFFLMSNVLSRYSPQGPLPISGNFSPVLGQMLIIILFITPILTMRLISEERKQKTDQLLHTVPISTFEIVLAKYLSAIVIFVIGLIISALYPLFMHFMGGANITSVTSAYLGFILVGASFTAICLFASAITESQFISAILGFGIVLGMWFMEFLSQFLDFLFSVVPILKGGIIEELLRSIFELLSIISRYSDFQSGILRLSSIVYYISIVIIFIFLTMRAIDKRRWTEG